MKLTIGVMGSSGGEVSDAVCRKVYRLGEAIAERDAILITGGCPGLPYEAVKGSRRRSTGRTEHFRKPSCFCDGIVGG